MNAWLYAASAGALLVISATFSASETAFFSLTKMQRERLVAGSTLGGRAARQLLRKPSQLLMTLLLSNLLVNLLYLSLATALSFQLKAAGQTLWAPVVVLGALVMLIIAGEVVPKSIARSRCLRFSRWMAAPILVVAKSLSPAVRVLAYFTERMTAFFVGPAPVRTGREQFLRLAELSRDQGEIAEQQRRILHELFEFSALKVRDVMVPRVDVVAADLLAPRQATEDLVAHAKRSRVLAYNGNLDQVEGQLIAHEVLLRADAPLRSMVKPVPVVPEQGTAETALNRLRHEGTTMALVVDEYGGTAGILTVHDLLGELIGELTDEHEVRGSEIVATETGQYYILGRTPLREWREESGEDEWEEGVTTVGGFVMGRLDRSPQVGDNIKTERFAYRVCRVRGGRILIVEAVPNVIANQEQK